MTGIEEICVAAELAIQAVVELVMSGLNSGFSKMPTSTHLTVFCPPKGQSS
jgi:hypothetical protein